MEVLCVAAVMIFARVAAPRVLRIAIAFRGSMISAEWLNGEGKRKKGWRRLVVGEENQGFEGHKT